MCSAPFLVAVEVAGRGGPRGSSQPAGFTAVVGVLFAFALSYGLIGRLGWVGLGWVRFVRYLLLLLLHTTTHRQEGRQAGE